MLLPLDFVDRDSGESLGSYAGLFQIVLESEYYEAPGLAIDLQHNADREIMQRDGKIGYSIDLSNQEDEMIDNLVISHSFAKDG